MSKFAYVALAGAAMSLVMSAPAMAQDAAAMTSGGDVTAEEATPLPPVVVEAPSQPLVRKKKARSVGASGSAPAQVAPQQGPASTATARHRHRHGRCRHLHAWPARHDRRLHHHQRGDVDVQQEHARPGRQHPARRFVLSRVRLDQLERRARRGRHLGPRFRPLPVPLYMDGVRIYLPADNRLDMNRFLTPDLAEIQVAKGYVSVLNGPGGEGGAINIVSAQADQGVRT